MQYSVLEYTSLMTLHMYTLCYCSVADPHQQAVLHRSVGDWRLRDDQTWRNERQGTLTTTMPTKWNVPGDISPGGGGGGVFLVKTLYFAC